MKSEDMRAGGPRTEGVRLVKYDRPGKSRLCKAPNDSNSEQRSESSGCEAWVRGPPVRMPQQRAALRLNGEEKLLSEPGLVLLLLSGAEWP